MGRTSLAKASIAELKKRISKGVKKKFELERILSEDEMEAILVGAAESFASSLFFIDRKVDAVEIYNHLDPEKYKGRIDEINEDYRAVMHKSVLSDIGGIWY